MSPPAAVESLFNWCDYYSRDEWAFIRMPLVLPERKLIKKQQKSFLKHLSSSQIFIKRLLQRADQPERTEVLRQRLIR